MAELDQNSEPTGSVQTAEQDWHHVLTFPFAVATSEGGLTTGLLREAWINRDKISFVTGDENPIRIRGAEIIPADPPLTPGHPDYRADLDSTEALINRRFNCGNWQLEFPDCYTHSMCPPEVLREMFAAEKSSRDMGSVQYLFDYVERHGPSNEVEERFSQRYQRPIRELVIRHSPERTVVNFQGAWFAPLINQIGFELAKQGVRASLHLRGIVPKYLSQTTWGQGLMRAASSVGAVFVHAQTFKDRLIEQLGDAGLPIPKVEVFDLGIDFRWADEGLALVNPSNFKTAIPDYRELDAEQQALFEEVFRSGSPGTQHFVPHRIIIPERIEAQKGTHYVLEAVDMFLEKRKELGEDIAKLYRFFFLHELWSANTDNLHSITDQYLNFCRRKHEELAAKYPGTVWAAKSITGKHRIALPALEKGCHFIAGGAQDGFNVAVAESAYINRDEDTALVVGMGAGFAMEATRRGFSDCAFFCTPGRPEEFANALTQITETQASTPGQLRNQKARLVQEFILTRHDRLAVVPPLAKHH